MHCSLLFLSYLLQFEPIYFFEQYWFQALEYLPGYYWVVPSFLPFSALNSDYYLPRNYLFVQFERSVFLPFSVPNLHYYWLHRNYSTVHFVLLFFLPFYLTVLLLLLFFLLFYFMHRNHQSFYPLFLHFSQYPMIFVLMNQIFFLKIFFY